MSVFAGEFAIGHRALVPSRQTFFPPLLFFARGGARKEQAKGHTTLEQPLQNCGVGMAETKVGSEPHVCSVHEPRSGRGRARGSLWETYLRPQPVEVEPVSPAPAAK